MNSAAKISNVITYRDDIDDAVIKLGEIGGERIVAKSMSALRSKLNEINRSRASQGLALMTLAIPLSACGGGSDSSSVVETVTLSEVSGRAIDGYLIGSMVSLSSAPDVFVQTNSAPGQEGSFEGLFGVWFNYCNGRRGFGRLVNPSQVNCGLLPQKL